MQSFYHFLIGLILLPLYFLLGPSIFIAFAANVLIDLDHIQILIHEKAFTLKKISKVICETTRRYDTNQKRSDRELKEIFKGHFFLFHSIEFNLILFVLGVLFYSPLIFVTFGFLFHIATDAIHHRMFRFPVMTWLFISSNSIPRYKKDI